MICLVVVSIMGVWCYQDAAPVGTCYDLPGGQLCYVDARELPIRASWYDPFLDTDNQAVAAVQCMEPCHLLGDGTAVADGYGWAAACPMGWYGRWIDVQYAGRWQCRDHGGAVHPTWGEVYIPGEGTSGRWYLTVDFLLREQPAWGYLLLEWG